MAVIGQILNIKIVNVTNTVTQLYNHSDIYNKVLEIKKKHYDKDVKGRHFHIKRDNKMRLQYRKKMLKRRGRTEKPWNQMPKFQGEFNRKQD